MPPRPLTARDRNDYHAARHPGPPLGYPGLVADEVVAYERFSAATTVTSPPGLEHARALKDLRGAPAGPGLGELEVQTRSLAVYDQLIGV